MSVKKIKIGISACLLGQKVRFDGQHKYHWYINEVLGKYFDYVPVCPEFEVGMGIPRKTVRLVGDASSPQMIEPSTNTDWTSKMHTYSDKKAYDIIANKERIPSLLIVIRKAISRFLKCYFSRKGYKEGKWGFLIALMAALFVIFSYLKASLENKRD